MLEQLSQKLPKLPSIATIRAMRPIARREMRNGLWMISPWLFGFTLFTFLPMMATLVFSFLELNITDGIFSSPKFVGFENYKQLWIDPQAGVNPMKWFSSATPARC